MKVSFGGIGETVATFYNSETNGASPGGIVKISGNGEVCACSTGERFAGAVLSADVNVAAVQIGGYITLAYEGTDPVPGFSKLSAASASAVKTDDAGGKEYLVIEVDTSAKTVGFML